MMTLKIVDLSKTQKSKYLENKTFFLQTKKFVYDTLTAIVTNHGSEWEWFYWEKTFWWVLIPSNWTM